MSFERQVRRRIAAREAGWPGSKLSFQEVFPGIQHAAIREMARKADESARRAGKPTLIERARKFVGLA